MVTSCYNLQLNEYFFQNLHKMIPFEHLTDVWIRGVSKFYIFFKVAFTKYFDHYTKLQFFKLL